MRLSRLNRWRLKQPPHRSLLRLGLITALACLWTIGAGTILMPLSRSNSAQLPPSPQPTLTTEAQTTWQPPTGIWTPVPSHREDYGPIKVVWLQGTSYEMGYQHGTLLHNEIASLGREVIDTLNFFGKGFALGRLAERRSLPEVVDECRGLVAATADIGITLEACMTLAFGDVYQEFFTYLLPQILFNDGCANFVAAFDATIDGQLYHGRTLDNNGSPLPYWIDNPTIFVRQPNDGIPHMFIAVPGVVWPNSGMNAEGITISLDTAHALHLSDLSLHGTSNVQLMSEVMRRAHFYDEAYAIMESHARMRANLIIIADGKSQQAGVFELLGDEMGVRELGDRGTLYMTNHFLAPGYEGRDVPTESSFSRYRRFEQVLEPDGIASVYGQINPEVMVNILRDRTNPDTFEVSPFDVFDDDVSIGGNGSLRQEVFDPQRLLFWVAAGSVPIPENPFRCFSLGEMLNLPGAASCPADAIP